MNKKLPKKEKRSEKSENGEVLRLHYVEYRKVQEPLNLQAFIRWISIPKYIRNPSTQIEFAKKIGVSQDTLTDWKHLIGFWKEVQHERQSYFREQTTEVLAGLLERAKSGKAAEVKLFLQYFEGFSERHIFEDFAPELTEEEQQDILKKLSVWGVVNNYRLPSNASKT